MRRVLLKRVKRPKDRDYAEMITKIGCNAFLTDSQKCTIKIRMIRDKSKDTSTEKELSADS